MKLILFFLPLLVPFLSIAGFYERNLPDETISALDYSGFEKAGSLNVGMILPTQCPATALSPSIVIIATHCMQKNNQYINKNELKFVVLTKNGPKESMIKRTIIRTEAPAKKEDWGHYLKNHILDVAVLELFSPIEEMKNLEIGAKDNSSVLNGQLIRTVGYPYVESYRSQMLVIDQCQITNIFHDNIYDSNCSFGGGSSGGPMLIEDGETITLIGIMIGDKLRNNPSNRKKFTSDIATYSNMFFVDDPFIFKIKEIIKNSKQ